MLSVEMALRELASLKVSVCFPFSFFFNEKEITKNVFFLLYVVKAVNDIISEKN